MHVHVHVHVRLDLALYRQVHAVPGREIASASAERAAVASEAPVALALI